VCVVVFVFSAFLSLKISIAKKYGVCALCRVVSFHYVRFSFCEQLLTTVTHNEIIDLSLHLIRQSSRIEFMKLGWKAT